MSILKKRKLILTTLVASTLIVPFCTVISCSNKNEHTNKFYISYGSKKQGDFDDIQNVWELYIFSSWIKKSQFDNFILILPNGKKYKFLTSRFADLLNSRMKQGTNNGERPADDYVMRLGFKTFIQNKSEYIVKDGK